MKTIYEVTYECPDTGELISVYRGGNKKAALEAKRDTGGIFRSYYAWTIL